jgi:hypothetical protein
MGAEDFHQKHKTGRVGVKTRMSPAAGGSNRIMTCGPKGDGTYVVAISVPRGERAVLKHFQERMPYGLFVPGT